MINKSKFDEKLNKIHFIDASKYYFKDKAQNILSEKNIDDIFDLFQKYDNIDGVTKIVSLDEIRENDHSLSIQKYVYPINELEKTEINSIYLK